LLGQLMNSQSLAKYREEDEHQICWFIYQSKDKTRETKGKALICWLVAAIRAEGGISISFTFFPM